MSDGRKDDSTKTVHFSTPRADEPTKVLSIIALSLIILTWISILAVLYYPFKELDMHEPVIVAPKVVAAGESIRIRTTYFKYSTDAPEFTRALFNLDTNTLVSTIQSIAVKRKTGPGAFDVLFPIPDHKDAVGNCVVKLTFRY